MSLPAISTNTLGFRTEIATPRIALPPGACDSHMHIVGPLARFPFAANRSVSPPAATWSDYRRVAAKLGIDRNVIVQPSFYGSDNRCMLDALEQSAGRARGVVVVGAEVTADEIRNLHERGVRGVRVQTIAKEGVNFDVIETVSARIAAFGWHLELYLDARELPTLIGRLRRLPLPIVFDHMAQVAKDSGIGEPGFDLLRDLMAGGRAWVKLSHSFFRPCAQRARALLDANPDRVLWASDWPHVPENEAGVPDDGELVNLLADWAPDEGLRHKVLVDNPAQLYFFPC